MSGRIKGQEASRGWLHTLQYTTRLDQLLSKGSIRDKNVLLNPNDRFDDVEPARDYVSGMAAGAPSKASQQLQQLFDEHDIQRKLCNTLACSMQQWRESTADGSWSHAGPDGTPFHVPLMNIVVGTADLLSYCMCLAAPLEIQTSWDERGGQMAERNKLATQVNGVLPALATHYAFLAETLTEQPCTFPVAANASSELLKLWWNLVLMWPTSFIASPQTAPTVLPAARLAAALLKAAASSTAAAHSRRQALGAAATAAAALNRAMADEMAWICNSRSPQDLTAAQREFMSSPDVQQLLILVLALVANRIQPNAPSRPQQHQQRTATAAKSSAAPSQPPPHQLLKALGVADIPVKQSVLNALPDPQRGVSVVISFLLAVTNMRHASTISAAGITAAAAAAAAARGSLRSFQMKQIQQQASQQALSPAIPEALQLPLLHTLLYVQVQVPEPVLLASCCRFMRTLCQIRWVKWLPSTGRTVSTALAAVTGDAADTLLPVLLDLGPVMLQQMKMGSKGRQGVFGMSFQEGSASGRQELGWMQVMHGAVKEYGALVLCLLELADPAVIATAVQQQPVVCTAALEAAIRVHATKQDHAQFAGWQLLLLTCQAVNLCFGCSDTTGTATAAASSALAGAAAASAADASSLMYQLFSMLITSCKAAASVPLDGVGMQPEPEDQQRLWMHISLLALTASNAAAEGGSVALRLAAGAGTAGTTGAAANAGGGTASRSGSGSSAARKQKPACSRAATASSSSSTITTTSSSTATPTAAAVAPWIVVQARSLSLIGSSLTHAAKLAARGYGSSIDIHFCRKPSFVKLVWLLLKGYAAGVAWMQSSLALLDQDHPAREALQQLLHQQGQLVAGWAGVVEECSSAYNGEGGWEEPCEVCAAAVSMSTGRMCSSSEGSFSRCRSSQVQAAKEDLLLGLEGLLGAAFGPQLQQLVAAVCAQLPVRYPYCCNNPGCSALCVSGLKAWSEWQLLNRKGTVCGSCSVARYCCKGCQAAHWKQHKPVCKRLSSVPATKATSGGV